MVVQKRLTEVTTDNGCICPGDTVTYECTVDGDYGGFTVWKGDFFRCSNNERQLELMHPQSNDDQAKVCNDGDIVGSIVRIENDSFISQLNITLASDMVGKEIECAYDNGTVHRVDSLNITKG